MVRRHSAVGLVFAVWLAAGAGSAVGQGLIWNLPQEGTQVVYYGEYDQKNERPDIVNPPTELIQDNQPMKWIRQLTLRSLGQETAEFEGNPQPCRWIEIKVVTGTEKDGAIDPGPAGTRIDKVLVPESKVVGNVVDQENLPVSYIPIVRGWRKLGEGAVTPIQSNVLQVYPAITWLQHYRTLEPVSGEPETLTVDGQQVSAIQYRGVETIENRSSQSTNEAQIWRSADVPFGLVQWTVKVTRKTKEPHRPRSAFKDASAITVTMKAVSISDDAQSELATPED